ncbi:hypothetical protein GCM10022416_23190 [Actinomadura keratinilytica]|uniref:Uncharacterized protein n=1 Tax=Actinomadura keratinilytica TaxID=547461 RepID=A0ABP7YM18_9ACTN
MRRSERYWENVSRGAARFGGAVPPLPPSLLNGERRMFERLQKTVPGLSVSHRGARQRLTSLARAGSRGVLPRPARLRGGPEAYVYQAVLL